MKVKPFKTYQAQVDLLRSRGMQIEDNDRAVDILRTHNYYRLSGYWHSMRQQDPTTGQSLDVFRDGTSFDLVVELYDFDALLRHAVFEDLAPIELALRSLLGYYLGQINPLIYLDSTQLGPAARTVSRHGVCEYDIWLKKYQQALRLSREDFVEHHRVQYNGVLPVWVAVEVMDWGMLSYLYRFSPNLVRNEIARDCEMSAPQLESWLKSLNILRNCTAHHARLFTRVFDIKPKQIRDTRMTPINSSLHLIFGQLSLIRYLHATLDLDGNADNLITVLENYPHNTLVPLRRTGTPDNWQNLDLWIKPPQASDSVGA
ncbi:Abi family protein [Gardnerella vaginalis]|uniref:Abi family protein n=1 Tax=Gardnerella vaginalis TaxID=2702 RepID=UPI0039EEEECC